MYYKTNILKIKKASVFIYTIILINVALILAMLVLNNFTNLFENNKYTIKKQEIYYDIQKKTTFIAKKIKVVNNNGNGFIDNISCPGYATGSTEIVMSGATKKQEIVSTLINKDDIYYCTSIYDNKDLDIFFNSNYDGFSKAKLDGEEINLNGGPDYTGNFSYDYGTKITIVEDSYKHPDGIDDDFNDDNYN